jgi:pyridoxal phosphate phosphatase PHOSPHO2
MWVMERYVIDHSKNIQITDSFSLCIQNDYCPATRLREGDRMFVRSGKALSRYLEANPPLLAAIHADVTYWDSSNVVRKAVEVEKL